MTISKLRTRFFGKYIYLEIDLKQFMLSLVAVCSMTLGGAAHAEEWPSKSIRLIVPFPAGGPTDFIGREVAEILRVELDQSVFVENRPGGNGTLGLGLLAKAAPDGYTLGLVAITVAVAPHLQKVSFDSSRDFSYITNVSSTTPILLTSNDAPYSNLQELVTYAKRHPDKIAYGTPGVGTMPHLAAELLQNQAEVKLAHIPYKGAAQQIQDLIGGSTQLDSQSSLVVALPQIQAGRVRPLAVLSDERAPQLPQVPTAKESGYPGMIVAPWFGVGGPAGLAPEIAQKVHAALAKGLASRQVQEKFAAQGNVIHISRSPAEFAKYAGDEYVRWGKIITEAGIKAE